MLTSSIVLYKNSIDECHSVLDCLLAAPVDRIYLVDHSGDDRLSILTEYSPKIEYIPHANLGYGSGHNVAIKKALTENATGYHIVLNADVIFSPRTITLLRDFMDIHPNAGLCMPDLRRPNGNRLFACKFLPSPIDLFGKRFLPRKYFQSRLDCFMMKNADYSQVLSVPWLSGCFMFLRISVLRCIGGFDERFFMYAEDIDFSRRIHKKFETLYCPDAQIIHIESAASYHSLKMCLVHIVNVIRYFNKWGWFYDPERRDINKEAALKNHLQGSYRTGT